MSASKKFFSTPLGMILIIGVIVGIGVAVYFGLKDDNSGGITNTQNFRNFRVTYYNTEGTNIQDGFSSYLEQAMNYWEDKIDEEIRLDLDVRAAPLRGGGDITIN